MRIAIGGFHIESSAFTPYRSGKLDFRVLEGAQLLRSHSFIAGGAASDEATREQDKPMTFDVIPDVDWIPLIHMRALPGGPIESNFYAHFLDTFSSRLRAATCDGIDGVLLDIHGAALVEGITDAEGTFASQVRNIVGPGVIIGATMDLHGNISQELFESCNLLTCYRTAPHIDAAETRYRAARVLTHTIRERLEVHTAKVSIPILLPGEKTSTVVEPGKSLYREISQTEANPSILDAAIWMGFPWGDEDRCRGAVVVSAKTADAAKEEASRLADAFWQRKDDFVFVGPAADYRTAATQALKSDQTPFFLSDTGDNTGAGGIGDLVILLRELQKQHAETHSSRRILIAAIYDPEVVMETFSKTGESFSLSIGGKLAPEYGQPFTGEATVERSFHCPQGKRSVVLGFRTDHGKLSVIVTEARTQYGHKAMFQNAGIDSFASQDIIVVKMGYLEPDLAEAAEGWVMAITPGAVDQELSRVPYTSEKCKQVYPISSEDITFDSTSALQINSFIPSENGSASDGKL